MSGIEASLATSALKTSSGFIDALLAPKIQNIRKWANDKELSSYLKNDKFFNLMDKYLERIVQRSSYLSTLVFPQEKIRIDSIYEPSTLVKNKNYVDISNPDSICNIDLIGNGKCYLIVDEAGMGKSTFAKHLCIEITKFTDKIPILFELSEYDTNHSLLENLARDFDDIDNAFDRELFKKLLVQGRFFIVLDGYDEAPQNAQSTIRNEIKKLNEKKGNTSLVFTSRPQDRLPTLIDSVSLKLSKLDKTQAISILNKYDAISGLDIGKNLQNEIDRIPTRFLETPLLVGLLYRTYGFNNSIADKITVFYVEIYEALYKGHDLTKSGYVREKISGLDIDNFRQLLRAFSFLYIARDKKNKQNFDSFLSLVEEAQELCAFDSISSRAFLEDMLLSVPLLSRDGNSLKFMHRSIAEYFAAEYISNMSEGKDLLNNIVTSGARQQLNQTIEYLMDISPNIYRDVITKPIAEAYLSEYNTDDDPIFRSISFEYDWAISIWKLDEVLTNDTDQGGRIEIPDPTFLQVESSSYMYGHIENIEYVACCSVQSKKFFLPRGARLDLTEILIKTGHNFTCIRSDENLQELKSHIKVGQWYDYKSKEIEQIHLSKSLQELMGRGMASYLDHGDTRSSIRVFTLDKCNKLIDSVEKLKAAESNITKLLNFKKPKKSN